MANKRKKKLCEKRDFVDLWRRKRSLGRNRNT